MSDTKITRLIHANMYISIIWFSISTMGFWPGLGVLTGVRKYVLIVISFKITKLIPNTYSLIIYVAAVTYMICNKDNTQKCGWSLGRFLAGGSENFVLDELGRKNWPVGQQVNPLASGLTYSPSPTHWPIGWPVNSSILRQLINPTPEPITFHRRFLIVYRTWSLISI